MRLCSQCGREFQAQLHTARFCSGACRARWNREKKHGTVVPIRPSGPAVALPAGATIREHLVLELGDRVNTVAGSLALIIAGMLDHQETQTAQSLTALSTELDRLRRVALTPEIEPDDGGPDAIAYLQRRTDERALAGPWDFCPRESTT